MANQDTLEKLVTEMAKDGKLTADEMNKAKKIKGTNVNLAIARMAVKHVKQNVKLVANWDSRFEKSVQNGSNQESITERLWRSLKLINQADLCVYGVLRQDSQLEEGVAMKSEIDPENKRQGIEKIAAVAKQYGCGNCMEIAAMAFMYLYRLKVRPLDYSRIE